MNPNDPQNPAQPLPPQPPVVSQPPPPTQPPIPDPFTVASQNIQPQSPPSPPSTPPPLAAAQIPQPTSITTQPTNKSFPFVKVIFIILVLLILIFVGGGFALAYNDYQLFKPPQSIIKAFDSLILASPLPKTPRLIVQKTAGEMKKIKTVISETQFDFTADKGQFPIENVNLTVRGPLDFKTLNRLSSEFDLSGTIAVEGLRLSAGGSFRQIGDLLYFRITEIPAGSFLPLEGIKNQWFVESIKTQTQKSMETLDNKMQVQQITKLLEDFFDKSYLWTIIKKTSGPNVYEITVRPPKEELNNLLSKITEILEPKDLTQGERLREKEKLREVTDNLEDITINLSINKNNYLITQSSITVPFKVKNSIQLFKQQGINLAPLAATFVSMKVSVTTKYTHYNQPIVIEVPRGAKNIQKYLEELQSIPQEASASPKLNTYQPGSGVLGAQDKNKGLLFLEQLLFPKP